jgi:hypothetical protein
MEAGDGAGHSKPLKATPKRVDSQGIAPPKPP